MSTGSCKTASSTNTGVRTSRGNVDAARKWVAEDTRAEAKEVFVQHTKETSGLDVLSRCKKLNELLSSDVLKGKGDPKAQLKEILGILHTGPKRPAFLNKPPVTATAGKRGVTSSNTSEHPSACPSCRSPDGGNRPEAHRHSEQPPTSSSPQVADDVDDLISLLNGPTPPQLGSSRAQEDAERQRLEREAQKEAERKRRALEAEAAERRRKALEAEEEERKRKALEAEEAERKRKALIAEQEAERKRKEQQEAERKRAAAAAAEAEAQRIQRLRQDAALCIQTLWRGYCARRLAARRRREVASEQAAAASILQAAWRSRQAAREYRQRLAAACALQCVVRAWSSRRRLQTLRVQAFIRHRAARVIQRAFCAYRARGYTLGPLRVPNGGRTPSAMAGVDGAALLAKQLRLRSAVDARLAPECPTSSGAQESDAARNHRTVVTHMERMRQVSATERNRRSDVSERAIMVASEHRDTAEALAIARQGFGTASSRTLSPTPSWTPAVDAMQPDSRRGSRSRQGSETGSSLIPGYEGTAVLGAGMRPPSGKYRA